MKNKVIIFIIAKYFIILASNLFGDIEPGNIEGETETYHVSFFDVVDTNQNTDIKTNSFYASMEFNLEILSEKEVRISVVQIYINPIGIERIIAGQDDVVINLDEMKKISVNFTKKDNMWRLSDPIPNDMQHINKFIVVDFLNRAISLIFPNIPNNFEPRRGFEWTIDDNQQWKTSGKITEFKIDNIYDFMEIYRIAVIKGEYRKVITEGDVMSNRHKMLNIEYDVKSGMAINAIERKYHRQRFMLLPRPRNLTMSITNVARVPND